MTPTDDSQQIAQGRSRRLSLSFATSIVSKVGSLIVLAVALPIAIRALGTARYGAYSALVAGVAWLSVVNFGTGPALTRAIAKSKADNDLEEEKRFYSNAVAIVSVCSLIAALGLLAIGFLHARMGVLGPAVKPFAGEASQGLALLTVLVPITMFAGLADAIYVGHQEQYVSNTWALIYSLISIPAFLAVRAISPTLPAMVLAVYGPLVLTKIGAYIQLLAFQHRYLRFSLSSVQRSVVKTFLISGAGFFVLSAGSYVNTQLAVYVAGLHGAVAAAQMGALMQLSTLAFSLVTMGTGPLWPALIEARERRDAAWLSRTLKKTMKISGAFGAALLVGFGLVSPWLAGRMYHVQLPHPHSIGWAAGLFVGAAALENVLLMISLAFGSFGLATKVFIVRSLVVAALYVPAINAFGIQGILVLAGLSIFCGPLQILYFKSRDDYKAFTKDVPA